jgi:hypothetical protein
VIIISLVEENVLSVFALLRVLLEYAVPANAMLGAKLLPKLIAN